MVRVQSSPRRSAGAIARLTLAPQFARLTIRLSSGQFLFTPGRPPRYPYLITSGLMRVGEPARGQRLPRTFCWLGPGQVVGWWTLARGLDAQLWARADRETQLIPLPLRPLARRVAEHPRLALELLAQVSQQLALSYVESGEQIHLEAPQRLARAIARLATHAGLSSVTGSRVVLQLTHADLASRTGISRETVSLILSRWRRQGIVSTGRGQLSVDLPRLRNAERL